MNGKSILAAVTALLLLAGCGGDDNDRRILRDPGQSFTAFTKALLKSTDNTAEPVSVNDRTFNFNDRDNPEAYDDVLSSR